MKKKERLDKLKREIKEHPERFDFQDVPNRTLSKQYNEDMDQRRPDWVKKLLAKRRYSDR